MVKNRGKWETGIIGIAVALAMAAGLDGCMAQTQAPILAESSSLKEDGLENTGQEPTGVGTSTQDVGESENLIRALAQAPERYTCEIGEDAIEIRADAPIEIPDVGRVPDLWIENDPYTQQDCEAILEYLKSELGISGWVQDKQVMTESEEVLQDQFWVGYPDLNNEGQTEMIRVEGQGQTQTYRSQDGNYYYSFQSGQRPDSSPISWLTCMAAHSQVMQPEEQVSGPDGTALGVEEKEQLEQKLGQKAEAVLAHLSANTFSLKEKEWRRLVPEKENGESAALPGEYGDYALQLTYVRSFDGITTVNRDLGWMAAPMAPAQYITILYRQDGTLLNAKSINRERISSDRGNITELMPFNEITQIFEQYSRYYQDSFGIEHYSKYGRGTQSLEELEQLAQNQAKTGESVRLRLEVTRVSFGYQLLYDDWDQGKLSKGSGSGKLVPVWAFYGNPAVERAKIKRPPEEDGWLPMGYEDGLLLTINAQDGTVYGKK